MPSSIRVYLNDRGLTLPEGASAHDAIRAGAPELLADADSGNITLTDARALPLPLHDPLVAGAILRVSRGRKTAG